MTIPFFELIRLAIGTQDKLSHLPSPREWKQLYAISRKQCLEGICFAGVQRLSNSDDENYAGMSELQYFKWMSRAVQIMQTNQLVDRQCIELQNLLASDGIRSTILKGQGVALLYDERLRGLRQSGDIDIWVDAPRDKVIAWAKAHGKTEQAGRLHIGCHMFDDTDVEFHFTPATFTGIKKNRMLQDWFEMRKEEQMTNLVDGMTVTTAQFDIVHLILHIFGHYLAEGVGLRQIMDFYWVLSVVTDSGQEVDFSIIDDLGVGRFAGALMWVMKEVFGMSSGQMIYTPDEKRGRRLLEVVMEGGNFGHSSKKYKVTGWDKPRKRLSRYVRRNLYLAVDYPDIVLDLVLEKFCDFINLKK